MIVVFGHLEVRIQTPSDIDHLGSKNVSIRDREEALETVVPEVGAIEAISAMDIPTRMKPIYAATKVQMSPPGPPLPKPKARVDKIVSHVLIMMRAKPKIETKPKLR